MKTFKTEVARGRAADANPWGVLLDLDQTLVLTSRIAHLRDSRRWSEASRSMGETSFPPGHPEVSERRDPRWPDQGGDELPALVHGDDPRA